jgi:hypothetical protein
MYRPPPPPDPVPDPNPEPRIEDQCHNCGAPLSQSSAFCSVCGASQQPRQRAVQGRPQKPRRPWWVPAGIVAGGLAAIIGGGLVGTLLLGDPDPNLAAASATPTPSASASTDPSSSPDSASPEAASQQPTAAATATPAPAAAIIPNRAIAEVVTDDLNLRAASNQSAEVITILKRGQRVFIIGEPAENGGLRWYRVATVDDPAQCDHGCNFIGFVATPLPEEDRWVAPAETSCPTSPMTAEAIGRLQPLEALSCYGRTEIVVTGTMDHPFHGPMTPYRFSPGWLTDDYRRFMREAGWIWFRAHPDSGLNAPDPGQIVRVTGHLEHPAATDCRARVDPEFFGGQVPADFEPLSGARVILDCRATFVWTAYSVLGFESLAYPPGDPLVNDAPGAALRLDIGDTIQVRTDGATAQPELPCPSGDGEWDYPIGRTGWWSFTGTGGPITVDTAGSNFDTIVGIYRDDEAGNFPVIGCVDDVDTLQARITVSTEAGVTYLIQAGGFNAQSGMLVLSLR